MHLDIRIQTEDFSLDAVLEGIRGRHRQAGAVVAFVGLVRERGQGAAAVQATGARPDPASALYLEHYPGVTERSIEAFARQAQVRWPLLEVVVVHRIGWLEPCAQIVLVVTVSSHRQAAFESAAFLMDYLKTDAVLWKKERAANGDEAWIEATQGDRQATQAWNVIGHGADPAR